jgi:hypothetical protein
MQSVRKRLTYANVMSSIAVFLVLGGATAFAANQLGKNTVGAKQLKKNAVTMEKIKNNAVIGTKIKDGSITTSKIGADAVTGAQVNESTLSTVPSANSANTANLAKSATTAESANIASSLTPAEPVHLVGSPGQPPFESGSTNISEAGISLVPVGFWKDHDGNVHLQGYAKVGKSSGSLPSVFTLPSGFRPAAGTIAEFEQIQKAIAIVIGSNVVVSGLDLSGKVLAQNEEQEIIALEGITFRPGS